MGTACAQRWRTAPTVARNFEGAPSGVRHPRRSSNVRRGAALGLQRGNCSLHLPGPTWLLMPQRSLMPQRTAISFSSAARLAQSAERKALNLVVVGSSPTVGGLLCASLAE